MLSPVGATRRGTLSTRRSCGVKSERRTVVRLGAAKCGKIEYMMHIWDAYNASVAYNHASGFSEKGFRSVGRLAMLEHCQAPRSSPRRPTSSRSTVPRCRRTSRRLRDVPSSRFTRHRPSGATLQRRFGGSASNAPREQPTGNLDGRRLKCSTMMAATLHGQKRKLPPYTHTKIHTCPLFCVATLTRLTPVRSSSVSYSSPKA